MEIVGYEVDEAGSSLLYGGSLNMFFITGLQIKDDKILDQRVFGFYHTYEEAQEDVLTNNCDIHEYYYNYMVIEHIPPGLYPHPELECFFEWDENKEEYFPTMKPSFLDHWVNFALG